MLFYFNYPQEVSMWMKDTLIDLDIIYLNDDQEVIHVYEAKAKDEQLVTIEDTYYVLEVNSGSNIKVGDVLEFEDDEEPVMKVLALDGSVQGLLWGSERIFSRKNSQVLIRKAKKAQSTQDEKDYKSLGRYMFKCIKTQDNRENEYVEVPK